MNPSASRPTSICRLAIAVRGVVQGVGFWPFVYNLAATKGLGGWVLNEADVVRIEVEGPPVALEEFVAASGAPPPQARIDEMEIGEIPSNGRRSIAREISAA